jgi:hypothetical protein
LGGFQHSADRYRCSSLHMKASVLPVSCGGSIYQCYNVHLLCKHRCLSFLQFASEDWKNKMDCCNLNEALNLICF